jgi:hypothetical protein
MTEKFCTRTARKIRKLGYAPRVAIWYSRFFCISMLSVSGIMIAGMRRRKGVKIIGEETQRSLRHMPAGFIASIRQITGTGIIIAGPATVYIVPASSLIHRY